MLQPSMFGNTDGKGQSLVYYFSLPEGWEPKELDNPAALALAQRFIHGGTESDKYASPLLSLVVLCLPRGVRTVQSVQSGRCCCHWCWQHLGPGCVPAALDEAAALTLAQRLIHGCTESEKCGLPGCSFSCRVYPGARAVCADRLLLLPVLFVAAARALAAHLPTCPWFTAACCCSQRRLAGPQPRSRTW